MTQLVFLPSPVEKREPVVCANVHGGRRGAATHRPHSVLLQDLQGLGALATCRQHHLRLQGERGHLSAGKQEDDDEEEKERGPESVAVNVCSSFFSSCSTLMSFSICFSLSLWFCSCVCASTYISTYINICICPALSVQQARETGWAGNRIDKSCFLLCGLQLCVHLFFLHGF